MVSNRSSSYDGRMPGEEATLVSGADARDADTGVDIGRAIGVVTCLDTGTMGTGMEGCIDIDIDMSPWVFTIG